MRPRAAAIGAATYVSVVRVLEEVLGGRGGKVTRSGYDNLAGRDLRIEHMGVAAAQAAFWASRSPASFLRQCRAGVIGIVLASLVNIFVASSALQLAISVIGVPVFTRLTPRDTQRIKEIFLASDPGGVLAKKALMGALALYLVH